MSDVGWHFHESEGDDGVSVTVHVSNVGGGPSVGVGVEETTGSEVVDVGGEVLKVGVGAHFDFLKVNLIKL